jgi:hypothetical protein
MNDSIDKKLIEKDKEIRILKTRILSLTKEKDFFKEELAHYKSTRLGRLVQKYYLIIKKYPFLKIFFRPISFAILLTYKFLRLFMKKKVGDSIDNNFLIQGKIREIIMKSSLKEIIFFIAPVVWDIPLYQRPQHIAKCLSKEGILYFYLVKGESDSSIKEVTKNCYEVRMSGLDFAYILEAISGIKYRNFFLQTYSTELVDIDSFVNEFKKAGGKIIYEYIDEISEHIAGMEIPEHVVSRFENLVKDEENTFFITSASRLYEDAKYYRENKLSLITNGVEYEHFATNFTEKDLPFGLLRIYSEKKPIIGYYGAIASWMDYELIKKVAEKRPEYSFVIIGLDYDGSVSESGLEEYSNIFVLPPVSYRQLPRYGYFFDVCMIPFKINEITKSTSPIKLFEYMALHKPIVTTAMPECKKYKSVMTANTEEEFALNIDSALKLKTDKKHIELLDKEAKANTWEAKAKEIIKLIRT